MNKLTFIQDTGAPSDLFEKGISAGEQRAFDKILAALRSDMCRAKFYFHFAPLSGSDFARWLDQNREKILK